MFEDAPKKGLQLWKELGPLCLNDIIKNSRIDPQDLDFSTQEIKKIHFMKSYYYGMFKPDTEVVNGVCRRVIKDGQIQEGLFVNDELNGFARVIYEDGDYYIGMFKDHDYYGHGKMVNSKG